MSDEGNRPRAQRRAALIERALDPLTPADELAEMSRHDSWRVRRAVASNALLASEFANPLASDSHSAVRRAGASRLDLSDEALGMLAADPDDRVRLIVAANPSLSAALVEMMVDGATDAELSVISERPDLSTTVVRRLIRSDCEAAVVNASRSATLTWRDLRRVFRSKFGATARWSLARNPNLKSRQLRWLVRREKRWDITAAAYANPAYSWAGRRSEAFGQQLPDAARMGAATSSDHALLRKLARSRTRMVRFAVAQNPKRPPGKLAHDKDPWVRAAALANPSVDSGFLNSAALDLDQPAWVLRIIANNPVCEPEQSEAILTWISLGAAQGSAFFDPVECRGDPSLGDAAPSEWYSRWKDADVDPLSHPLWRVRLAVVSGIGTLDGKTLRTASRDPRPEVRYAVAGYAPLTRNVFELLSTDEYPYIANRVISRHESYFATKGVKFTGRYPRKTYQRKTLVWSAIALTGLLLLVVAKLTSPPGAIAVKPREPTGFESEVGFGPSSPKHPYPYSPSQIASGAIVAQVNLDDGTTISLLRPTPGTWTFQVQPHGLMIPVTLSYSGYDSLWNVIRAQSDVVIDPGEAFQTTGSIEANGAVTIEGSTTRQEVTTEFRVRLSPRA